MNENKIVPISFFLNKVIERIEGKIQDEEIFFYVKAGSNITYKIKMYHVQQSEEEVYLEDIIGDFDDILNDYITTTGIKENITESSGFKYNFPLEYTFYELGTSKGSVIFRWYGEPRHYSTEVELLIMEKKINGISSDF